jgi:chemotaxis protein methyltransferase CheR
MNQALASTAGSTGTAVRTAVLSQGEFAEISRIVRDACGINLTESKMDLVHSRLQKRLRLFGLNSFAEYIDFVKSGRDGGEFDQMISALTTNVTRFHRESHHFDHFDQTCLPRLMRASAAGEPVRIWSAGCSNGSEPYNIAGVILDKFPDAARRNFKILGTDIDIRSLAVARSGRYTREYVEGLPETSMRKWFEADGSGYQVKPELRQLVTFNTLNLIEDWPMRQKFDAIFCRNVMIYFARELQEKLLQRFVSCLKPEGFLYIGHSERVSGPAASLLKPAGSTIYQYNGG